MLLAVPKGFNIKNPLTIKVAETAIVSFSNKQCPIIALIFVTRAILDSFMKSSFIDQKLSVLADSYFVLLLMGNDWICLGGVLMSRTSLAISREE